MLLENKKWNYYTFENHRLNLILSTDIECLTPAYQSNIIGVFMRDKKYNFLKTDGKSLLKELDYISPEATYGINENSIVIFNSRGDFYNFYNK